ncbi:MAG: hypothetical protein ACLFU4_02050 [Opitutales bacterium]
MKRKLFSPLLVALCGMLSLITALHGQAPQPLTNPVFAEKEIILSGPLLGEGEPGSVILLDRETGLYQAGLRDLDSGEIIWQDTRSSGLPAIDDAALGRLNKNDPVYVAVTHADSNQLAFFQPHGDRVETHPRRIASSVPRPGLLAAGQFDLFHSTEDTFYEDFALLGQLRQEAVGEPVTTLNFTEGLLEPEIFAQGHLSPKMEEGFSPYQLSSLFFSELAVPAVAQKALKKGGDIGTRLTLISQKDKSLGFQNSEIFGQEGQPFIATTFINQAGDYESMLFSWNESEAKLYGFFPDQSEADQMQECVLNGYQGGLDQVVLLEGGTRDLARILVIGEAGTVAGIHEHDGVYCWGDIEHAIESQDKQALILGAAPDGAGGFTLLSGPAGGPAENWATYERDGDDYNLLAEGKIPQRDKKLRIANLFAYQANPFLNPGSAALDIYRYRDWTIGARGSSGVVEATGLEFQGGDVGISPESTTEAIVPIEEKAFYLPNQIADNISVSTLVPIGSQTLPTIGVEPLPGNFDRTIRVRFTTSLPDAEIYYQTAPNQSWQSVSLHGEPVLYQDTSLRFFAENEQTLTPTQTANYTFTQDFQEPDSNRDGLPDFVRDAFGLDPLGPLDTTGNGYTDLEEILAGSDPLDPSDVPADEDRLTLGTRLNVHAFVQVQDLEALPEIDFASAADGEVIRAADTAGTDLGQGRLDSAFTGGPENTVGARVKGIEPNPSRPYLTLRTNRLLSDASDHLVPEKVALQPMPRLTLPEIDYTPTGEDLETEVENWLAAAREALSGVERETLETPLSAITTLQTAIFERHLALLWAHKENLGSTPAVTLLPQRTGDGSRVALSRDEWRLFAQPDTSDPSDPIVADLLEGWQNLEDFLADSDSDSELVRRFAREMYQVHREHYIPGESSARPPLDAFRHFLENDGTLPVFYADNMTLDAGELSTVDQILDDLSVGLSPARPATTVLAEIQADTFSGRCRLVVDADNSDEYLLLDGGGGAYRFPSGLRLPAGTLLSITGFTDTRPVDEVCVDGSLPLEVFSIDLAVLPAPLDADIAGNLLPESWEELHFGATGQDAFADASGNGYSNLEHYLRGRGPFTSEAISAKEPVDFTPPHLRIRPGSNGNFEIEWEYGEDLADYFQFRFEKSTDLVEWTPFEPVDSHLAGQGEFHAEVPPADEDEGERSYYRFQIELRDDQ